MNYETLKKIKINKTTIKASHDMELQFLTNQDRRYRKHCQYTKTVQ